MFIYEKNNKRGKKGEFNKRPVAERWVILDRITKKAIEFICIYSFWPY